MESATDQLEFELAGKLEWIDTLRLLSRSGFVQFLLVLFSLIWTTPLVWCRRHAAADKNAIAIAVSLRPRFAFFFEVGGQIARVAAVTFAVLAADEDVYEWPGVVLLLYIFLLGLLRPALQLGGRRTVIHQISILSIVALVLFGAEVLPLLVITRSHKPNPMIVRTLASVSASIVFVALAPLEWVPPPPELGLSKLKDATPSEEETSSWLDYYVTFGRLNGLIWSGFRRSIGISDLPRQPWYDSPDILLSKIVNAREKKGSTLWAILHFSRTELFGMCIFIATFYLAQLISPYSLYQLLAYLTEPEHAVLHPYTWLLLMLVAGLLQMVTMQQYKFIMNRAVIRVKTALTAELYHRALLSRELGDDFQNDSSSKAAGKQRTAAGQLANLMSSDIATVTNASQIVMIVGWPSLVGLFIIIACFPLPAWIIRNVGDELEGAKDAQDSRISLASEYLGAIRVIKYFTWEDVMTKYITDVRAKEQKHLWRAEVLFAVMGEVAASIPILALLVIFTLYVGLLGQPLTAPVAFTTVSLVWMIKKNLYLVGVMSSRVTNARISLGRLDKFFAATSPLESYPIGPLRISAASFRRNKNAAFYLDSISIKFVEGGLNVVTGPSGSGKTTLLLAILGETIMEKGQVTRPIDVAYTSQTPWLQSQSIRDNILFNTPFDTLRYQEVVNACCLDVDLNELPNRDYTDVGENGAALSGGQRARVALARAIYSSAPVLLLDDIFSALDTKTASSLWNRVFCSDMLKNKSVVLVTQLSWVPAQADLAITLHAGRVDKIEQNLGVVRSPVKIPREETNSSEEATTMGDHSASGEVVSASKTKDVLPMEIEEEMATSGSAGRLMFLKYMVYFGGPTTAFLVFVALILLNALLVATTWWLSYWVDASPRGETASVAFYLGIYVALNIASTLMHGGAVLSFARGAWVAARRLHDALITAVMNVSLSWYKTTPVGRVVNRLSGDMDSLDQSLGHQLMGFLDEAIRLLFQIGAISSIFPVFIVPCLVVSAIGIVCGEMYTRTAVVTQRLVSSSRSPVFSQFSESLNGLAVIRSQRAMPSAFGDRLARHLSAFARASAAHNDCDCWLAFRIQFLTTLVTVSLGFIAVEKAGVLAAGLVGFSLTNATGLSSTILNLVGIMNDLDIELQSFHRVEEYCRLPAEEQVDDSAGRNIPPNWPRTGRIEYRNVTVRYDLDGPDILKDINLTFEAGERVAIVGRTGSGKSTLVLSLLRFTHILSGEILYDGVNIATVPRTRLRQAMATIPQEAFLFQGTVGLNLDPSGQLEESRLQKALDSCASMHSFQTNSQITSNDVEEPTIQEDRDNISLSTPVHSEGSNFSHGQRQMLSLCRTLVRRSKLMLLDEATASMDTATDAVIQAALREEMSGNARDDADESGSRSLVTIAHRLRTIADYDKVVVMGGGKVLEVGKPRELVERRGVFYDMVIHSGENGIFG